MTKGMFLPLLAGFTVWAGAFLCLYGLQATGCRLGWDTQMIAGPVTILRGLLLLAFSGFASLLGFLALRHHRARDATGPGFVEDIALYATYSALASTLLCFMGIFWLTLC